MSGRPNTAPDQQRRTHHLRVPLSPEEHAILLDWSEREGAPLAELVRDAALEAAE